MHNYFQLQGKRFKCHFYVTITAPILQKVLVHTKKATPPSTKENTGYLPPKRGYKRNSYQKGLKALLQKRAIYIIRSEKIQLHCTLGFVSRARFLHLSLRSTAVRPFRNTGRPYSNIFFHGMARPFPISYISTPFCTNITDHQIDER